MEAAVPSGTGLERVPLVGGLVVVVGATVVVDAAVVVGAALELAPAVVDDETELVGPDAAPVATLADTGFVPLLPHATTANTASRAPAARTGR
jgi:hypothetical protein